MKKLPIFEVSDSVRNARVVGQLKMVKIVAAGIHRGLPPGVDLDDLISVGVLGLFDASSHFDCSKAQFKTYAEPRVRGIILDSLRRADHLSRDARAECKIYGRLRITLGRKPTDEEAALKLGLTVERWRRHMTQIPVWLLSASMPEREDDSLAVLEVRDRTSDGPFEILLKRELRAALAKLIAKLPARTQVIIALYYDAHLTISEISRRFHLSQSRITQIHQGAMTKMRRSFEAQGVHSSRAFLTAA